jgi:YD repeat-containing protein
VASDNYRTREFIVYEYSFDDNGKISEMRERSIGRGGQYEETCRYVNSELVSRTFAPGEGGYDDTPYTVEYRSEHDGQGRLIRSIGYYNDTAIASVEYVYDGQGRLTRKTDSLPATARSGATYILSDDQEQIVTEYRYGTDGSLSQITETMIDSSGYEVILESLIINGDQLSNGEYEGSRDGAIITLQDDEDSNRSYVSREDLISGAT